MSRANNETDVLRAQTKSVEQLDTEHANDAPGGRIPVAWSDGATGQTMQGRPLLVSPSAHDIDTFGARANTCGLCKFYDLERGRKELIKQRFPERLVREQQWKLQYLGDIESLAVCRQRPTMAITYISKSCELFQLRRKPRS